MAEIRKINIKPGETIQITCEENEAVQTTPTEDCTIETQSPNSGGEAAAEKQKGNLRYKVGALSDFHIDTDGDKAEAAADLTNALDYMRQEGVDFIESCGDLCEYNDEDLEVFRDIYTAHAWAPTSAMLRFFTAIGNHDYLRLYTQGANIAKLLPCFTNFTGEDLWAQYGYKEKTDYIQFFE